MENKNNLRETLIATRSSITDEQRRQWDASINAQLIACWLAHPARALGIYWPVRGEPDLRPAYAELFKRDVQLALPVVIGDEEALKFSAWKPGDDLITDKFGVPIPATFREVKPHAVLLPCVGFNEKKFRLGYGGGFYDRTLAPSTRPVAIGIAYACTLAAFDAAPHDIALDKIITNAMQSPAA